MFYQKYKYKSNDGPGAPLIAPWAHSDAFQRMRLRQPVLPKLEVHHSVSLKNEGRKREGRHANPGHPQLWVLASVLRQSTHRGVCVYACEKRTGIRRLSGTRENGAC